jgi:hypothetical protein
MRKSVLLLLATLFCSYQLIGQYNLHWKRDAALFNKIGSRSVVDNNDNVIVTGYYQSENIYTRKYDINGNFLWETVDSSGVQSMYEKPMWINCDSTGNIFVIGKRYSIGSSFEYPDAVISMKYNSSGVLLWKNIYPVSVLVGTSIPSLNMRSEVDSQGNLYIGTVAVTPAGFNLIKYDSNGNQIFVRTDNAYTPRGLSSMRMKGGKLIISGNGVSSTAPVVSWDTSGTLQWTISAGTASGIDVEIDNSGNWYKLTSVDNKVSPTSATDVVIVKYNSLGQQIWERGIDMSGYDFPVKFTLVNDRISGIAYGPVSTSTSPYFDWKTFQLDTAGTLLWDARFNGTIYNDEYPYAILAKPNGNVIVAGIGGPSPNPSGSLSYIQMVILEYNNSGSQVWLDTPNVYGGQALACMLASDQSLFAISYYNMSVYHYNSTSVGLTSNNVNNKLKSYPNPTTNTITLEVSESENNYGSIIIHDLSGRSVVEIANPIFENNSTTIDIANLKSGIYIAELIGSNSHAQFKIIKQ